MTEKQALNEIFKNIKSGEVYGYIRFWDYYHNEKLRFPYFENVLFETFPCRNIGYCHFGSSATKETKENLAFVIHTIFNLSAIDFLKKYITETQARNAISGYEKLMVGNY